MAFVDTSSQFQGTSIGDYGIHYFDSHPNARAQRMFAVTLYEALYRQKLYGLASEPAP